MLCQPHPSPWGLAVKQQWNLPWWHTALWYFSTDNMLKGWVLRRVCLYWHWAFSASHSTLSSGQCTIASVNTPSFFFYSTNWPQINFKPIGNTVIIFFTVTINTRLVKTGETTKAQTDKTSPAFVKHAVRLYLHSKYWKIFYLFFYAEVYLVLTSCQAVMHCLPHD